MELHVAYTHLEIWHESPSWEKGFVAGSTEYNKLRSGRRSFFVCSVTWIMKH